MRARTLIFTACYNEHDNVGPLLDEIVAAVPDADILVVDDNSPDGTWAVLQEKCKRYPQLTCVQRPRKLGIGSAHKYALFHAMREGYTTLVTMDADFSHSPGAIPGLLARHGPNAFVTGSRYCEGGTSDYDGYRNIVSRAGNLAARWALGVKLRELTTYFRVFDVASLKVLPLRKVSASGYSYGVELIHYLSRAGIELREVPIHFADRMGGVSKIPRMQILWSALDIVMIFLGRCFGEKDIGPDEHTDDPCANCGDRVLALKYAGTGGQRSDLGTAEVSAYRCTSVGRRSHPPIFVCLCCGLMQVAQSAIPRRLEALYAEVEDADYLANRAARRRTFNASFEALLPHFPAAPGTLLEFGAYCGLFLAEARRRGWQADGVEPSRWAAVHAREHEGVTVFEGTLADNRERLRDRYDVVANFDVLEHVRDPAQFLRECGSMLGPGGILCFSTLDADNWYARWMGARWPWLLAMHLYYFDRRVVADLLRRNGFEMIAATPYAHYARLEYAIEALAAPLPRALAAVVRLLGRCAPRNMIVRVALGDIKLYVARKSGACVAAVASAAVPSAPASPPP